MNFRKCSNLTTSIHPSYTAQKKSLNSSPQPIQQTKPSYTKKPSRKPLQQQRGFRVEPSSCFSQQRMADKLPH
jgi:hypothetical protein